MRCRVELEGTALVAELDRQPLLRLGHSADLIDEIHVPRTAAELAVGYPLEADLLLHADRIANRCVLDAAQLFGREPPGLMLGSGPQQFRRAQQAADMIGAERGCGSTVHEHLVGAKS